ncbi:MAG: HdeD family acid-resistance protein [Actinomycetota bacterium]
MDSTPSEPAASAPEETPAPVLRVSLMRGITLTWWMFLVRGLVAVGFGLVALVWPEITLIVLVVLFAAFALVDGIVSVVSGLTGRESVRWWMVVWGLVGVAVGIGILLAADIGALALVYVIAAWATATGALQIAAAISWRKEIDNEWILILGGILSVIVGIAMAVVPGAGALALVWLIGAYAVVFGVLQLMVGYRLRDLRHRLPVT